mmetsp:Transcript_12528/g.50359  ORF Transcript_12528/g.50359 Transcript_12528/m.50359 type:complete len:320 (+) Transcript_12528:199-1158(+)
MSRRTTGSSRASPGSAARTATRRRRRSGATDRTGPRRSATRAECAITGGTPSKTATRTPARGPASPRRGRTSPRWRPTEPRSSGAIAPSESPRRPCFSDPRSSRRAAVAGPRAGTRGCSPSAPSSRPSSTPRRKPRDARIVTWRWTSTPTATSGCRPSPRWPTTTRIPCPDITLPRGTSAPGPTRSRGGSNPTARRPCTPPRRKTTRGSPPSTATAPPTPTASASESSRRSSTSSRRLRGTPAPWCRPRPPRTTSWVTARRPWRRLRRRSSRRGPCPSLTSLGRRRRGTCSRPPPAARPRGTCRTTRSAPSPRGLTPMP